MHVIQHESSLFYRNVGYGLIQSLQTGKSVYIFNERPGMSLLSHLPIYYTASPKVSRTLEETGTQFTAMNCSSGSANRSWFLQNPLAISGDGAAKGFIDQYLIRVVSDMIFSAICLEVKESPEESVLSNSCRKNVPWSHKCGRSSHRVRYPLCFPFSGTFLSIAA